MKPRVLFLHNYPTLFVKMDREILKEFCELSELWFKGIKDIPKVMIEIKKADFAYSWFGGFHSLWMVLFSKLYRKPTVIVAGGYDVASCPEINYGAMRKGARRLMGRLLFKFTKRVLSVSPYNYGEIIRNARVDQRKVNIIPLGVPNFEIKGDVSKTKRVVTIGRITKSNFLRKGLLTFVNAARFLPNIEFILVGEDGDGSMRELKSIAPLNVRFTGYITEEEKSKLLLESKVYVQPSHHEAFGVAVAEAMLRKCIPVVTKRGALPYLVGDAGVYSKSSSPKDVAEAIKRALSLPDEVGERARKRILENFSIEKRKDLLFSEINSLLGILAKNRRRAIYGKTQRYSTCKK